MSAPFVTQLRSRTDTIRLGAPGAHGAITIRVEMPEVWDTVRLEVAPDERVIAVKQRALTELGRAVDQPDGFVMKINGFEVLDEQATLRDAGARSGSIFLLTSRRRRPVR